MLDNNKKVVGWQKFENLIEDQFNSPIVKMVTDYHNEEIERFMENEIDEGFVENGEAEDKVVSSKPLLAVPGDISNEIYLSSSYDCWIGHTNFDITKSMTRELSQIPGIEALKTISRYRFFIGIGRMFSITNIRKDIEETLGKGDNIESRNIGRDC
jgi:hypothetical protein